ncbi:MAG: hypothetical protein IIX09_02205, partial [Clostridia bacterium]|nr:hypothetical protein [Clostridia bacterium]
MYLHAGNNKILRSSRIIGIFDLDTSSRGDDTKEYLRAAEKNGLAESAAEELPKSFILYEDEDGGWNKTFSIKGLSLNIFFTYMYGNQVMMGQGANLTRAGHT